ncbi:uncharacterized protein LOC124540797 isoform X1 [Vanessa cardui]|uniref:uncharacterized protein LOC124540797 isoform X1 n=1 Tax=Vanessa cardui TaxID=171605 RepID=UPI001F13CFFD|nr:uncharacterized protein LOC124540797 isoform X1 [Vanessa cardui]
MDEENKLPLKRVELSLTKFNEVAIPHHLDLLRQHKANIIKYEEAEEYARVRSEQVHARRVAAQLRALLGELDALRRQVRAQDVPRFDRLTQRSRDLTLRAIMDYLGVIERSCIALVRSAQTRSRCSESSPMAIPAGPAPPASPAGSARSGDSVGVLEPAPLVQLQVDQQELQLREREAVLRGWGELQAEVRALHDAWQHVQAAALAQREQVGAAAASVDVGADNLQAAREHLALGERLRAGAWGAGGALAGALAGGPVGLVLGAKAGAAALLVGSALGYVGARLLGRRRLDQLRPDADADADADKKAL